MTTLYAKKNLCHRGSIIRQGAHLPLDVSPEQLERWQEEDGVAPVPVVIERGPNPPPVESFAVGPMPPPEPEPVPIFPMPGELIAGETVVTEVPGLTFPAEPAIVAADPKTVGGPTYGEDGKPVEVAAPAVETTPAGSGALPEDGPVSGPPAGGRPRSPTLSHAEPALNMADGLTDLSDADAKNTPPGVAGPDPASPTPPVVEIRGGKPRGKGK